MVATQEAWVQLHSFEQFGGMVLTDGLTGRKMVLLDAKEKSVRPHLLLLWN